LEPVTRERFQRAKAAFFEAFRSSVPRETPYDRWMAEAPRRKADREGLRATLPPAQAAALLKTLEDAERDATASLKAADAADRAENARLIEVYTRPVERARAQLAAMGPADRVAPAWIERRAEPPGVNPFPGDLAPLVTPETPLAARVVVPRLEMYQGQRSRMNPRVIQVQLIISCQAPAVQRAMFQAYRKLDWAALARLVEAR
jgi:hypothetical protein